MELEPKAAPTMPSKASVSLGRQSKVIRPTRRHRLRVPVTPAEKKRIENQARAMNLPSAVYLRLLGLGQAPRTVVDNAQIEELFRVAGDVGRFGGVLKLWLTDDPKTDLFDRQQIQLGVSAVAETKAALRGAVRRTLRGPGKQGVSLGEPWQEEQPPRKREIQLQVPATPAERARIQQTAAQSRCSVAAYLRDRGLRYKPTSPLNPSRLQELLSVRQELTRCGNLLKRWLVDDPSLTRLPAAHVHAAVQGVLDKSFAHLEALRDLAQRVVADA